MRRIVLLVTVAAMITVMMAMAGVAWADHIPTHQHAIITPGEGDPSIAQGFCAGHGSGTAFDNLHNEVHTGQPRTAFNNPDNPVSITVTGRC